MIRKKFSIIHFCLLLLVISWLFAWGPCWNPLEITCYSYSGWGDELQSYFGWITYAIESNDISIPPRISNWTWPFNAELLYADTIPILSIVFKPIFLLIKSKFQYFSLISLINILLTFWCGVKIGRFFNLKEILSCLLGIILAISPIALIRLYGHESLSLHFLIVYPITLVITRSGNIFKWSALIFFAMGIHAYYVPMISLLGLIYLGSLNRKSNRLRMKTYIISIGSFLVATIAGVILFGYQQNAFSSSKIDELWSANLLTFFDPQSYSLIFKSINIIKPYQWEGFSYFGLLISILIIASTSIYIYKLKNQLPNLKIFPYQKIYILILIVFFLIAIGSPIYIGEIKFIEKNFIFSIFEPLKYIFRATGRFIWPIYYSVTIWSYITIAKYINKKVKLIRFFSIIILIFMIETHFYVLSGLNKEMNSRHQKGVSYLASIESNKIAKTIKNNRFLINATSNPNFYSESIPIFLPQLINPNIKTNYFPRFARDHKQVIEEYTKNNCEIIESISKVMTKEELEDTLFIIKDRDIKKCSNYKFKKIISLKNENSSLYKLSLI